MNYQFPHTIKHKYGEQIIFLRMEGSRVLIENEVQPNCGPPMHTHFIQDECLTVVEGKIGYQCLGQEPLFAGPGETIFFERGVPHRFWNAGDTVLRCTGWIGPAETFVFFLSNLYDAMNRGKNHQPEIFDGSYLAWRYRREYDLPEIPWFVKNVIMPITYGIGLMIGKYQKFRNAPTPR
ncbi:MAG: cupin domain-containing protein [Saprospiraceae bacterium]